jgi:predicted ATPase/class 3 adenylate cyclase
MHTMPNLRLINEGKSASFFSRGEEKGKAFKVLKTTTPSAHALERLRREWRVCRGSKVEGMRQAFELETIDGRPGLVVEYIPGATWREIIASGPLAPLDFLPLAIAAAQALREVHEAGVMHGGISPEHLVIRDEDRQAVFIGFGGAALLNDPEEAPSFEEFPSENLAYIAPEQTGRAKHTPGPASDLYALGALFYEALTGAPPFLSEDPLELIHAHLAKTPAAPQDLRSGIPDALSRLVLSLLNKHPTRRYPSAAVLHDDLVKCLAYLRDEGGIPENSLWTPGSGRARPDGSAAIFEREEEIARLEAHFSKVRAGALEKIMIIGATGVGKTTLARTTRGLAKKHDGIFIEGKFAPHQRDIPYQAITQACRQLAMFLLTHDERQLNQWRKKIQSALGTVGKVITDLIPELTLVIGEQAPLPPLEGVEARNRFHLAFRQFIGALAAPERPLLMFIDDLQWCDADSLGLLKSLVEDTRISYFMLISALRFPAPKDSRDPNENDPDTLRKALGAIEEIQLNNLSDDAVRQILRETLSAPVANEMALVEMLSRKTFGNALFVRQLLDALLKGDVLKFDPSVDIWIWRPEAFSQFFPSGDVADLMVEWVRQLDQKSREVIAMAAVIGPRFDIDTLEALCPASPREIIRSLDEMAREGLIIADNEPYGHDSKRYRFAHDRIQEAAYKLLREPDGAQTHLVIGEYWLERYPGPEREEHLFEIVAQFNRCLSLEHPSERREHIAALNLSAVRKARKSAAFLPAYHFAVTGLRYLGDSPWEQNYFLALECAQTAAELAVLNGLYQEVDALADKVMRHARDPLDQERVVRALIQSAIARKHMAGAIETGLAFLRRLGIEIPPAPSQARVIAGLIATKLRLWRKTPAMLAHLPAVHDQKALAAMRVLSVTSTAAYFTAPNLTPLLVFEMLKICLRSGNSPDSAFAFGAYGFILSGVLGDYEQGFAFGKLSIAILEDNQQEEHYYNRLFIHDIFLRHWKAPAHDIIPDMELIHRRMLDLGNFEISAYAAHSEVYFSFFLGEDLLVLEKKTAAYVETVSLLNQPTTLQRLRMYHQAELNLIGAPPNPTLLKGEAYDEDLMLPIHHKDNISIALHNLHFLKAFLAFLFGEQALAARQAEETAKYAEGAIASFFVPLFAFLNALIALNEPRPHRRRARVALRKLKTYAAHGPDNYRPHHALAAAEYARVSGRSQAARLRYEDAIFQARHIGNLLLEAMAWEFGGKFYLNQQLKIQAGIYLQQAFDTYLRWGAAAKARQMERLYGPYLKVAATGLSNLTARANLALAETIDFMSLVKTLQNLSTEIELPRLLEKMMAILVENAGAERGLLLLARDDRWEIVAERDINSAALTVLKGRILEENEPDDAAHPLLPYDFIQYLIHTKEMLVINDVAKDQRFAESPYLEARPAQAMLGLPLLKQNRMVGILYLENTLSAGAFTTRIQEGLRLLSGQLAVSLENALLYEDLEDKVRQNQDLLATLQVKVEEQEKTLKVFAQFVPEPVVHKTLAGSEVSVWEGELKEVAVLFCDIRGFTPISEDLSPREAVELLNDYYSVMTEIIQRFNGAVNQFIGDEIFASFGAPMAGTRNEADAVFCALEMVAAMPELNEQWRRKFNRTVRIGIGINAGPVIAGNMGSKAKLAYSIIGDTVNTAKRIESLTKNLGNGILISERVYHKCASLIEVKTWPPTALEGKKEKIVVYEVLRKQQVE